MITKPLNRPTTSQNSRSILNWLLDKARVREDGSRRQFSGCLPHEAVEELVKVVKGLPEVERTERDADRATIYHYKFMMVNTVKGRFDISIRCPQGRQAGDTYLVKMDYRAVSVEELLRLYERGN